MQQFRQTQHRSVEVSKGNQPKELADLKKQVRLLERKNHRLMKELAKAVDVRHGFEAEPDTEDAEVPEKQAGCPSCGGGLKVLEFSTPGGDKSFVVCGCGYRKAA